MAPRLNRTEGAALRLLSQEGPMKPERILQRLLAEGHREAVARRAIQALIDLGKVEVTLDWELAAKDSPQPARRELVAR